MDGSKEGDGAGASNAMVGTGHAAMNGDTVVGAAGAGDGGPAIAADPAMPGSNAGAEDNLAQRGQQQSAAALEPPPPAPLPSVDASPAVVLAGAMRTQHEFVAALAANGPELGLPGRIIVLAEVAASHLLAAAHRFERLAEAEG